MLEKLRFYSYLFPSSTLTEVIEKQFTEVLLLFSPFSMNLIVGNCYLQSLNVLKAEIVLLCLST